MIEIVLYFQSLLLSNKYLKLKIQIRLILKGFEYTNTTFFRPLILFYAKNTPANLKQFQ